MNNLLVQSQASVDLAHVFAQTAEKLRSRKVVNAIYLLVPPLGLLFMCLSPFFTTRERLVRGLVTASFLAFFTTMGPSLQGYYAQQLATLEAQQR